MPMGPTARDVGPVNEPEVAAVRTARIVRWGRGAASGALVLAGLDWLGRLIGVKALTWGLADDWPQMTPWTAPLIALLAVAILVQSGQRSPARVRVGRVLAGVAGAIGVVLLVEYATGLAPGLSGMSLSEALFEPSASFPGSHPSLQTALSVLFLSPAIVLTHLNNQWAKTVWAVCLVAAAGVPMLTGLAYMFGADALLSQAVPAAVGLLLVVAATSLARPDRRPVAWLLAHPEHGSLIRAVGFIALLPILVAALRLVLLALGVAAANERVLSLVAATVIVGVVVVLSGRREQQLLAERGRLLDQRQNAEALYRLMAENAVDVVSYARGTEVVWVSPSVEAAFGWRPDEWIGTDYTRRVHPDDIPAMQATLTKIAAGESATVRSRVLTAAGDYRWVEGRGRPSVDSQGRIDGTVFSTRVIDEQVEFERRLKRLASLDMVTGLLNHRESMARLQSALTNQRSPGPKLGVLFCDVDNFKAVNDTWGHLVGDMVLATLATRMRECLRAEDVVGRTGGDEMLVVLSGLKNIAEARKIAETIRRRAAEPIHCDGSTVHVTLSIGATIAEPGESAHEVTARADAAMYEAKQAGRNATVCG